MKDQEDSKVLKNLGLRLREIRKFRGLSQETLAHQSGLDRSYVGQVERGERNISILNMCKLSLALKVPTYHLLFEFGSDIPSINL